jgi:hypothetical protein
MDGTVLRRIRPGKAPWAASFGWADAEAGPPMTLDAVFCAPFGAPLQPAPGERGCGSGGIGLVLRAM